MEKERARQAYETLIAPEIELRKLVLASKSPRRAEILRAIGWPFEIVAPDIDESIKEFEEAHAYVQRLAREKAGQVAARCGTECLVLGADTIVFAGNEILGKPRDEKDARRMLQLLSARRWHEVLTGVALAQNENGETARSIVAYERTRVRFAPLSAAEIDWYVASDEPMDKAGAYAVQGRAALFIEEIQGDYWNIVGLPVRLLYKLMREIKQSGEKS
jgi:septum formation protein